MNTILIIIIITQELQWIEVLPSKGDAHHPDDQGPDAVQDHPDRVKHY